MYACTYTYYTIYIYIYIYMTYIYTHAPLPVDFALHDEGLPAHLLQRLNDPLLLGCVGQSRDSRAACVNARTRAYTHTRGMPPSDKRTTLSLYLYTLHIYVTRLAGVPHALGEMHLEGRHEHDVRPGVHPGVLLCIHVGLVVGGWSSGQQGRASCGDTSHINTHTHMHIYTYKH